MNYLFPVFLKLEHLNTLVVGGGNVGEEKLSAILRNSPKAKVTVVATYFKEEVVELAKKHTTVTLEERSFEYDDLEGKQVVILATDNRALHEEIKAETSQRGILTNVADTPDLCDFYLGSVVQKGDLKIGISTNGKSPTLAKRIREYLEEALPDEIQELMDGLTAFRNQLKGDFAVKVKELNALTQKVMKSKKVQ
ncbi:bifunctional precorrin-2 dehydrogenase/sirohydrochlorin ferrochelatase [Algivirga pacifica]|uniref:precorrin-2 dehydrogenase n=1 Tax=Algivirga pacifica TaxID=1162670 RepID=A0ABP9DFJ2_9BACT